uniref:Uncharacterized protein n=1 Tax=Moniliophthora roreri TaxID=221103 RepID=A0A0W0ETW9_MONRR
MSKVYPSGS